jgi:hypothetical protein
VLGAHRRALPVGDSSDQSAHAVDVTDVIHFELAPRVSPIARIEAPWNRTSLSVREAGRDESCEKAVGKQVFSATNLVDHVNLAVRGDLELLEKPLFAAGEPIIVGRHDSSLAAIGVAGIARRSAGSVWIAMFIELPSRFSGIGANLIIIAARTRCQNIPRFCLDYFPCASS